MRSPFASTNPWESPQAISRGRLPMRGPEFPFPDARSALEDAWAGPPGRDAGGNPVGNPLVLCLDGSWAFALADNPESVPPDVGSTDFDDSAWGTIMVPGTWSLQGHDRPHYTNVIMPFGNVPPATPARNPTGIYRRRFTLPGEWEGRRVVLKVGSAESFLAASLNGIEIGFSKDSRLPAEFDLGQAIRPGENLLVLTVVRYSDASYIEDQDQWWFGGIHRTVVLYSTGPEWIQDIDARTVPAQDPPGPGHAGQGESGQAAAEEGSGDAVLDLRVRLGFRYDPAGTVGHPLLPAPEYRPEDGAGSGRNGAVGDGRERAGWDRIVSVRLYDPEGRELVDAAVRATVRADYRLDGWTAHAVLPVRAPERWNHESPRLYTLLVSLVDPYGVEADHRALRIGFRDVRISDRALLVDGRRVLVRGVNRHEHDERTGKTVSTADMIRDIELLKRHNFNAVRTSHYPDDDRWYDLCDRYGIYLFDEADIESHCHYDLLCRDQAWLPAFMERGSRMVLRDRNHPSVIVWSLGNESGYGPHHDALAAWIRHADPGRPVHYEGAVRPERGQGPYSMESLGRGRKATDIVAPMYPGIDLITEWDRTTTDDRPLVMCEYSHAMGNSNGSLADYWAAVEGGRALQGGFIWEWMDHGIRVGPGGADAPSCIVPPGLAAPPWRYGGDFGDMPSDLDFVLDGLLFPDRTPKPAMRECARLFRPVVCRSGDPRSGRISVRNRRDFTGMEDLELVWRVVSGDPRPPERSGSSPARNAAGEAEVFRTAPGTRAWGTVSLPPIPAGGETEIALDPAGDGAFARAVARASEESHAGLECWLDLAFALRRDQPWAKAGHIVATDQFPLHPEAAAPPLRLEFSGDNRTGGSGGSPEAGGDPPRPAVAPDDPRIAGLCATLFREPVRPCLYRAPTQNDGLRTFAALRGIPEFAFYYSGKVMYEWLDAGLDAVACEPVPGDDGAWTLVTGTGRRAGRFECRSRSEPGRTRLSIGFDLDTDLPELPRIGIEARLRPEWTGVRWFGLGPHETYPDREAGALVSLYESDTRSLHVPYIFPQENGNRSRVRWLELSSRASRMRNRQDEASGSAGNVPHGDSIHRRIRISADRHFHFGISPWTIAELASETHFDRLRPVDEALEAGATLHIDLAQRGVGTATCGPDTLERYRVRPGRWSMELDFVEDASPG